MTAKTDDRVLHRPSRVEASRALRVAGVAGLLAGLLTAGMIATPQQPRDTPAPMATGTAVLSGAVVTDDQNHRPVRHAMVTLGIADAGGRGGSPPRQTMTDDQGRFLFASLPQGAFSLTATRPGFLTGFYGTRRAGRGPSAPIALSAGQRMTDVTIAMTHGAAITGMVLDENGRPLQDVRVTAYEYRFLNGERVLAVASGEGGGGLSDDRGVYRIWGLQAGSFVIAATPVAQAPNAVTRTVTSDQFEWAAQQTRSSTGAGQIMTSAQPPTTPVTPAPQPGRAVGYAPVFYPGTTDPTGATPITIGTGEERSGVDLSLALVPTARVEGQVLGPDGQPVQGVQLTMTLLQGVQMTGASVLRPTPPDRTGKFSIAAAAPGTYRIMARGQERPAAAVSFDLVRPGLAALPPPPPPPPPGAAGQDLWASEDLTVNGEDISGIVLNLRPGMTVSGQIVFDGTTLPKPEDMTRTRVNLSPLVPGAGISAPAAGTVKADGTFQLTGAIPGKYRVGGSVPIPPGMMFSDGWWSLESAVVNGKDVLDGSLEIRPDEPVQGLVLTYTDHQTELSGALVDAAGKPASGYTVLVITTDRSFWPFATRRIRQVRPSFDGKYRTTGLPPGEYAIGAMVDLDSPDLGDTTFLEQVVAASIKVTLGAGEKKTQDLRIR